MTGLVDEEEKLLELARDTAERLRVLTVALEAYANATPDTVTKNRRATDRPNDDE